MFKSLQVRFMQKKTQKNSSSQNSKTTPDKKIMRTTYEILDGCPGNNFLKDVRKSFIN